MRSNRVSQEVLAIKNPPANAEDPRDTASIPGLRRSPGVGKGNSLPVSLPGKPVDRAAWGPAVHEVAKESYKTSQPSNDKGAKVFQTAMSTVPSKPALPMQSCSPHQLNLRIPTGALTLK